MSKTDRRPTPGMPRWVKIIAIAALALILLLGIIHLAGNGLIGPSSHMLPTAHAVPQP